MALQWLRPSKGEKNPLFPSTSNCCNKEKVWEKKTLPDLEGTHTGRSYTRRAILHTLFPQGQQPWCVLPEAQWPTCVPADLKAPCPWVSHVTWGSSTAVWGSFSWLHACHKHQVSQDSQKPTCSGTCARAQLGRPREFYQLRKHFEDQSLTYLQICLTCSTSVLSVYRNSS